MLSMSFAPVLSWIMTELRHLYHWPWESTMQGLRATFAVIHPPGCVVMQADYTRFVRANTCASYLDVRSGHGGEQCSGDWWHTGGGHCV